MIAAAFTDALRRAVAPAVLGAGLTLAPVASNQAAAVDIEVVETEGGLTAWLVEERAIPIISIQLAFRGGASRDPEGKTGLASLFAGLLEEGAGPYDDAAFAAEVEKTAARFSFGAGRDQVTIGATMLADRRDESLALLRLALTEPRFDQAPVDRVKAQIISGIRQSATDPNSIASRRWFEAAFPEDPYGRPTNGTEETVTALSIEDLRAAAPRYLNRNDLTIGVVGAISADELGPILDALLADLPDAPQAPLPEADLAELSGLEVVDFQAPQSTVLFGHRGLKRSDPDFIPAFVLNHVLGGGGFESRLMTEIREKEGLAYGVYSYLAPLDRSALYLGGVATANEGVARSIELVRREWSRLAEEGLSEDDLARAKTYLTGAYPLRFDSNSKIARFLVAAQQEDLGVDYIDRRNDLVNAVSVDDIKRVAERILKPEELFFVVVGQPAGL